MIVAVAASTATAQNLLVNPSFDEDSSGWTPANATIEAIYRDDVGSSLAGGSGPGAVEIRFSFWNGASGGVYQEVAVVEGTSYEAAFSAFAPSQDNPAEDAPLFIQWYDAGHGFIAQEAHHAPFSNDAWLRIEASVIAPAGAAIARVYPTVTNPSDPAETRPGVLYVDDVLFAETGSTTTVQEAFFPAAAAVAGLAGTYWTTDGWFRSASGATVELAGAFLPQGADNTVAVASPVALGEIPGDGTLILEDLVAALGGTGQTGGLYLRAEAIGGTQLPFLFATSYTSTPNPEGGGSYGQGIPAVGRGSKGRTVAPGAFQNADRRTNAGALNTSPVAISLRVEVVDGDGRTIAGQTWSLPPYAQRQIGLPGLGVTSLGGGSVGFELLSGSGSYRAYTSTVDAITGDAVYTAAQ
ncbi:MAG: hypothetical protein MUC56_16855 [Thermoanaerobaculales bacterium]|jgi:hypothetical protein|nr:hypothetical protein [Thermoanaerobaculales bacterium]